MRNLKALRKESGYTQKDFANKLKVSQQCYSDYENGKTNPDITTLIEIADLLHTSLDNVVGRTDDYGNIVIQSENYFDTSPLEQRLILDFRKLPPNMQDNFVTLFHNLAMGA
ncbi:MAG: helix-turn-helix domain-containing protein [Clostridia bacterium]|nr:helix-turn-helix domain-containing protein [Clostridia bacterium]